ASAAAPPRFPPCCDSDPRVRIDGCAAPRTPPTAHPELVQRDVSSRLPWNPFSNAVNSPPLTMRIEEGPPIGREQKDRAAPSERPPPPEYWGLPLRKGENSLIDTSTSDCESNVARSPP